MPNARAIVHLSTFRGAPSMMRRRLDGWKNSEIGTVPAIVPKKQPVSASLLCNAAKSCRVSAGMRPSKASEQVISYISLGRRVALLLVISKRSIERSSSGETPIDRVRQQFGVGKRVGDSLGGN